MSVIMPSLNHAMFIDAAMDSVLSQDYNNLELIVIDGGSTDDTLSRLQQKAKHDSRLRWLSEPDSGPAQALNKALSRVRGTVIGWLNADDLYTPGAITRAMDALHKNSNWLMVYGNVKSFMKNQGKWHGNKSCRVYGGFKRANKCSSGKIHRANSQ